MLHCQQKMAKWCKLMENAIAGLRKIQDNPIQKAKAYYDEEKYNNGPLHQHIIRRINEQYRRTTIDISLLLSPEDSDMDSTIQGPVIQPILAKKEREENSLEETILDLSIDEKPQEENN